MSQAGKMSAALKLLLLSLACITKVQGNQTCAIFGNNLAQGSAPNGNSQSSKTYGLFLMTTTPSSCAGNATTWDFCYYSTTTDAPSAIELGVYRPSPPSTVIYNLVTGSLTNYSVVQSSNGYICKSIALTQSQQFTVLPGDVVAACVQNTSRSLGGLGRVGVVGAVAGLTVLQASSPSMVGTLNTASATTLPGYVIHVKLGVNTCAYENGHCAQICATTSTGNACNCSVGYQLDPNGQNCSVNAFAVNRSVSISSIGILPTSSSKITAGFGPITSIDVAPVINSIYGSAATSQGLQIVSTCISCYLRNTIATTQFLSTVSVTTVSNEDIGAMVGIVTAIVAAIVAAIAAIVSLIGFIVIFRTIQSKRSWKISGGTIAAENIVALNNITYDTAQNAAILGHCIHSQDLVALETINWGEAANGHTEYEIPKGAIYDYTFSNEETSPNHKQERPFYSPASDECDLYIQLQNQRIRNIYAKDIQIEEQLGSGQFGAVFSGKWKRLNEVTEVAIKTLNAAPNQSNTRVKFLQEAAIMAQFRHPNVIQLYGIVTEGVQLMIVIELARGKDLGTHLKCLIPDPGELMSPDVPGQLLSYSQQIALGMQYLARKQFVHRDLAARNILVIARDKEAICKIADFGLSRELSEGSYYISRGGMIPVKWTAPEAIHYKKYSTASDVWSYGCLLYEIWSVGHKPFEEMTNREAIEKVDSGYRLHPPPGCPLHIYQIMIQCWNPDLHGRPEFRDICLSLSQYTDYVLSIPNEALLSHPQAGTLGAPLEAGKDMYTDLQKSYIT